MPHPIRDPFTVPWGGRYGAGRANGARIHDAADYHAPIGTPIYGTGTGGVVVHVGYNGDEWMGLGHNVSIAYPGYRATIDGHMVRRTVLQVGQAIGPDTLVGYVGKTGNAVNASPPGPHDHHRLTVRGATQDPIPYYGGMATASAGTGTEIQIDEDDMIFNIIRDTNPNGGTYLVAPGSKGVVHVRNPADLAILERVRSGVREFVFTEVQLIESYMQELSPNPGAHPSAPSIDQIKAAVAAALKAAPSVSASAVNLDELTAYLGSEFGKINANIDDQPTTFKITPAD